MEGIQQNKRSQIDLSGTISKAMSKNLLRNPTNVRSREKFKKYQVNIIASLLKFEVMQQIGIDICNLSRSWWFQAFSRLY